MFEKFTADKFLNKSVDPTEKKNLCKALEMQILEELDRCVRPAMMKIIQDLNVQGHRFVQEGEGDLGDVQFHEKDECGNGFLVALDVIVTVGSVSAKWRRPG
ncbi:hypothetical protein [Chitiniphilus shinanonensis]|uniref:hypothetical protein n=1 Tax=Chitiniphilus shinanonensis TaxID=553088 RepID=UPI00302924F6